MRAATTAEAESLLGLAPAGHSRSRPDFDLSATALVDLDDAGVSATRSGSGPRPPTSRRWRSIRLIGQRADRRCRTIRSRSRSTSTTSTCRRTGSTPRWTAILADAPDLSPAELGERLFDLRWKIFRAPLDPAVRELVAAEAAARWGADAEVRFRSSTNVEDLPDFSGAGLYTSAGADLVDGPQAVENAMKVVWASAWNQQAFIERDFYRVDHARVRMGLLVHPSMPDEMANGVAVTINEFADNRPAFYINAQLGEVSVTNPTGLAVPEQLLYYTWYEEPEYEIITRSSLVARVPDWPTWPAVLSEAELESLAEYLTAIHNHFKADAGPDPEFAMDVEWKLAPGRVIVIKQARPLVRR